jgi:hypothetical protein
MRDALGKAKQRLACEIDSYSTLPGEPIAADPWVVSSLLQKSIRRGETEIAQRAALTFRKLRGSAILRRSDVRCGAHYGLMSDIARGLRRATRRHSDETRCDLRGEYLSTKTPRDCLLGLRLFGPEAIINQAAVTRGRVDRWPEDTSRKCHVQHLAEAQLRAGNQGSPQ